MVTLQSESACKFTEVVYKVVQWPCYVSFVMAQLVFVGMHSGPGHRENLNLSRTFSVGSIFLMEMSCYGNSWKSSDCSS